MWRGLAVAEFSWGDGWPGNDEADSAVLVAVVNNVEDLRRAREEHWYRIPLRHAPRPLAARYVAFYLTAALGPERWHVRYLAEVRRYELRRRVELIPSEPFHPRSQELYVCLRLGPLEELPRPIPARRLRRVTFINTTLSRLLAAEDVRELFGRAATRGAAA